MKKLSGTISTPDCRVFIRYAGVDGVKVKGEGVFAGSPGLWP